MTLPPRFPKTAAWVAGLALLLMTLLGPYGFLTLQSHFNAGATPGNLLAIGDGALTGALVAFLVVALLDVAAAWGLYVVFKPAGARLSLISALLRVAYAVALAMLVFELMRRASAGQAGAAAVAAIGTFLRGWLLALGLFGLHLLVLGIAGLRLVGLHRVIAMLLVLAGLGYLADALGPLVMPGYALNAASFLFVGELVLMVWLFYRALRAR